MKQNTVLDRVSLIDFFYIPIKIKQTKRRVWYYRHAEEREKQEIIKEGRWYYYNSPKNNGGGEVGCDTLAGAKEDLLYSGAKVWCELIDHTY